MRISDWSSDVCSSDLLAEEVSGIDPGYGALAGQPLVNLLGSGAYPRVDLEGSIAQSWIARRHSAHHSTLLILQPFDVPAAMYRPVPLLDRRIRFLDSEEWVELTGVLVDGYVGRSEEHTSELQSLMRLSYADFCLKKKITDKD